MYPNITIKIQVQKYDGRVDAFLDLDNFELPIGETRGKRVVWQEDINERASQIKDIAKLFDPYRISRKNKSVQTLKDEEADVCSFQLNKDDFNKQGWLIKENALKKFANARWQRLKGLQYFQKTME